MWSPQISPKSTKIDLDWKFFLFIKRAWLNRFGHPARKKERRRVSSPSLYIFQWIVVQLNGLFSFKQKFAKQTQFGPVWPKSLLFANRSKWLVPNQIISAILAKWTEYRNHAVFWYLNLGWYKYRDDGKPTWQLAHSDTSKILLSAQTKARGISTWKERK